MKKAISVMSLIVGFLLVGYGLYLTNRSLEIMGAAVSPTPTSFVLFPPGAVSSFLLAVFLFLVGFIFIWIGIKIL